MAVNKIDHLSASQISLGDMLQLTTCKLRLPDALRQGATYAYDHQFREDPRTPKMNVLEGALRQQRDFAKFFLLVKEVLRGIRAGVFIPRKSFMCGDCEYGEKCVESQ